MTSKAACRRHTIYLTVVAIGLCVVVGAGGGEVAWAQPSGLVAAYSFNEGVGTTVADSSGNSNTGTISGAVWTSAGKFGSALVFDGTSARVTVPNASSLQLTTGMTLEAWVNPTAVTGAWRDVVYKGNDDYYLEATSPDGGVPAAGGTFSNYPLYGIAVLAPNIWTHLAVTYDGATLRLYVNGTQVAARAQTGLIQTSTNPLSVGGDSIYGQFFQGAIDEVRVYNTALTPAQVQADMNTAVASGPSSPTNLAATTAGTGEIDLSWTAPTSGVVSGYRIERCQGAGCSVFAEIAAPVGTATTYADTGLLANTSYSYRVRAVDGTGDLSGYSNIASSFTGLAISPNTAVVTFTQTQQFTATLGNVVWSVDGIVGGSPGSGTITPTGLYAPPSSIGSHTVTAGASGLTTSGTVYIANSPGVFTHHNDNFRTGQNLGETVLTRNNVHPAIFGRLFSYSLDGTAFGSPLYVANVNVPGQGFHNIVYVATEHDTVYAFDADGRSAGPLWQVSFINPDGGVTTVPAADTGETGDIPGEIGITGTPVIDPSTGTLYVVAKTKELSGRKSSYVQRLHALDIATGVEKFGGPVLIQAKVRGKGDGARGGYVAFDPLRQNQRPALLLANGIVYLGFASHGDVLPWHGWVLGYDATTLQQVAAYNVSPNTYGGGIWMSGGGLAADAAGAVYFMTGNGAFNEGTGDYGDSFVKLGPAGTVVDYFTPYDQAAMENSDLDLGSSGPLLLPDRSGLHPHVMTGAGKTGTIYLIDRENMGHHDPTADGQIVQSIPNAFTGGSITGGNFIPPVYFNGTVYFSPISSTLKAFELRDGQLSSAPASESAQAFSYPGAPMAISANATSEGILWVLQRNGSSNPGILRAYDASDLSVELYNSSQAGARDALDIGAKFTTPLIANGKVFVGSSTQLTVFGLLP
jgi:hypothetical protein